MFLSRIAPALLVAGCAQQDYVITEWDYADVFYQNSKEAVDILLVIDDSHSMEPYQVELGSNFETFLTYFVEADVDYRIATITTDTFSEDAGEIRGDIITPETEKASEIFAYNVAVGTEGSALEMGLEAALMALSEPLISGVNKEFLRDEAALSIIFVSDEEDGSYLPVSEYVNSFRAVKGEDVRGMFNTSALTVIEIDACDEDQVAQSTPGTRYVDAAQQSGGISGDLCAEDFESVVLELSLNTSRLLDRFQLSESPDVAGMEVTVGDDIVPCESGQWSYQLLPDEEGVEQPTLVFAADSIPPTSSRIAVRYYAGSGDPDDFCQETEEE